MQTRIKPEEVSKLIRDQSAGFGQETDRAEVGEVLQVGDGIARVHGLDNCQAGELLAEDLASCHRALGEITGEVSSDDLLGMIFGTFCIGK